MTAALLAVAHGSPDSRAESLHDALIARVRSERPELAAVVAYLGHSDPDVISALNSLVAQGFSEVVIVPLLLTSAYHARFDLPAVVEQARSAHPNVAFHQTGVLGPHPKLVSLMKRRLGEAGADASDGSTALVLAAVGTSDPSANAELADVAATLGATIGFASSEPELGQVVAGLRANGSRQVAVISYALAPGVLPDRFYDAGADITTDVLGAAPEVVEVILERYDTVVGVVSRT
jgi:sirohydrochlorin ferrochelatase